MSTEETPAKTSETLMLALHLGDRMVGSSLVSAFDILDDEPRESYGDRFMELVMAIDQAVRPLVAAANAKAEESAADYAEWRKEEATE